MTDPTELDKVARKVFVDNCWASSSSLDDEFSGAEWTLCRQGVQAGYDLCKSQKDEAETWLAVVEDSANERSKDLDKMIGELKDFAMWFTDICCERESDKPGRCTEERLCIPCRARKLVGKHVRG